MGGARAEADAQVLATALSVYATTTSLRGGSTSALLRQNGFVVTADGLGAATIKVPHGADFGVADNSLDSVLGLLISTDSDSFNDTLFSKVGKKHLSDDVKVFQQIAAAGGIN